MTTVGERATTQPHHQWMSILTWSSPTQTSSTTYIPVMVDCPLYLSTLSPTYSLPADNKGTWYLLGGRLSGDSFSTASANSSWTWAREVKMLSLARCTTTSLLQEAESQSWPLHSAVANIHSTYLSLGTMMVSKMMLLGLLLSERKR